MPPALPAAPQLSRRQTFRRLLLLGLLYSLCTLLFLRPGPGDLSTALAPDLGDPLFNLYVLEWGASQIRQGLPAPFDAPFFFPSRGAILLSDPLYGPALSTALVEAAGASSVFAYNLLFLSSFVLCGLTAGWVMVRSGCSWPAAALAGAAFAFCPYRLSRLNHLQVLLAQWIPLTLWFWDRLLVQPRRRTAAAFLASYALHMTGGAYLAYMVHVPMAALLANRWREVAGHLRQPAARRRLAAALLAAAAIAAAVFFPFLAGGGTAPATRNPTEWKGWGASVLSYVSPPATSPYFGGFFAKLLRPENQLFAGFLPTALAVIGVAWLLRRRSRLPQQAGGWGARAGLALAAVLAAAAWLLMELHTWRNLDRFTLLGIPMRTHGYENPLFVLAFAALLALAAFRWRHRRWPRLLPGPPSWERGLLLAGAATVLLSFPAFFELLAQVAPGLDHMRVPARFYAFTSFFIASFAARGWDALSARLLPANRPLALMGAALLLAAELLPKPLGWHPLPGREEAPPVYAWLARQRDVTAVLELPFAEPLVELRYMWLQRYHGHPLVNGYSGSWAPDHLALQQLGCCRPVPDERILARLREMGVSHVVLHGRRRAGRPRLERIAAFAALPGVEEVYAARRSLVFRIGPAPAAEKPP